MRIVFLGTAAFAVPALRALAAAGHEVPVVVTQPDRARGRSKRPQPSAVKAAALELRVPRIYQPEQLKKRAAREALESFGPFDVGVVAAYGQILTRQALAVPRHGMLNLHASLLPRWRGAAPVPRAILAGDRETGVSCQRVVLALDAGPVVGSRATPIDPGDTSASLLERLAGLAADLAVEVLSCLEAGMGTLSEIPQEESLVTYAPTLAKEEGRLDWTRDAAWLSRHVRAMQPWPRSFTDLHRPGGAAAQRVIVCEAAAEPLPTRGGDRARPGEILRASGADLLVACGGRSALRLHRVQPAGKRAMPVEAWLRGRPVVAGDRFGAPPAGAATAAGATDDRDQTSQGEKP